MNRSNYRRLFTLTAYLAVVLSCPNECLGNEEVEAKLKAVGADLESDEAGNVISVSFWYEPIATDRDLKLLKELSHLTGLELIEFRFTEAGLMHLSELTNLKSLSLVETKFTDADLQYIEGLTELEDLWLAGTAITDAAVPTLAAFPKLNQISLGNTRVTAEGIRTLRDEKPNLKFHDSWEYSASMIDGVGVLDMDRATITFQGIVGSKAFGGGAGGSIDISSTIDEEDSSIENQEATRSFGVVGSFGFGKKRVSGNIIRVKVSRENNIPTIRVNQHAIQIFKDGTEIVVDCESIELGAEKARIIVGADGVAKLEE